MKLLVSFLFLAAFAARAEEGMWLFNQLPENQKAYLKKTYGFSIDQAFLDKLRMASVRAGASASLVSPRGLLFTNHHVAVDCLQKLTTKDEDLMTNGFYAASEDKERKCPDFEANLLTAIEPVTDQVKADVPKDLPPAEANTRYKENISKIEKACSAASGGRCDVVTLFSGARYDLYKYKKFTDLRLVFAPEAAMGFFGGDPDNFTFPRFCFDLAFFRIYDNGKPLETPQYLHWSREGVKDRDLIFVSGHPGRTQRLDTMAQLEYYRDVTYPRQLATFKSLIEDLKAGAAKSEDAKRDSYELIFGLENSYKARSGEFRGLSDARLMAQKAQAEKQLRAAIAKNPQAAKEYGAIWDEVAAAVAAIRPTYPRRFVLEGGAIGSELYRKALQIYRLAHERSKPNDKRLPEYADARRPSLELRLFSPAPIPDSVEIITLTNYFRRMRETLGASDPLLIKVLDGRTPEAAAAYYVANTKLKDVAERKRIAASDAAADSSTDPMIALIRAIDPEARAARKLLEDKYESVTVRSGSAIAKARFAAYGESEYPDATFTLRLAYGRVRGYEDDKGKPVAYATRMGGLFERATGQDPYVLAKSWVDAKPKLNMSVPFNFVSTADITGGNSGSPTVNQKGEIVGIVFDGNIESLPNQFLYSDTQARAVHVDSRAIVEGLRKVYRAERLLTELGFAN